MPYGLGLKVTLPSVMLLIWTGESPRENIFKDSIMLFVLITILDEERKNRTEVIFWNNATHSLMLMTQWIHKNEKPAE